MYVICSRTVRDPEEFWDLRRGNGKGPSPGTRERASSSHPATDCHPDGATSRYCAERRIPQRLGDPPHTALSASVAAEWGGSLFVFSLDRENAAGRWPR